MSAVRGMGLAAAAMTLIVRPDMDLPETPGLRDMPNRSPTGASLTANKLDARRRKNRAQRKARKIARRKS